MITRSSEQQSNGRASREAQVAASLAAIDHELELGTSANDAVAKKKKQEGKDEKFESKKGLRERIDTAVSRVTRNRIRHHYLGESGDIAVTIYQRKTGRPFKVMTPFNERPVVGKRRDIVYIRNNRRVIRTRLGNLAGKLVR